MNELIQQTNEENLAVLDGLAQEARLYSEAFAMNAFQLGRVLTEAKKMVPHGEWLDWVYQNTGMGKRMVQDLMRSYQRFSGKPSLFAVEKSKLFKLLALPAGTEDEFLEEHDIANMSAREVGEAVKRAKAEARAEAEGEIDAIRRDAEARIEEANAAAKRAQERAIEAEKKPQELPDEVAEDMRKKDEIIARQKADLDRLTETARGVITERDNLRRENKEQSETIEELNDEYKRVQSELLNAQSTIARGDAERMPSDALTLEVFASAVRQFYGTCARLPMMGKALSAMDYDTREQYDVLLRTIEKWCQDSREAMNTFVMDGGVFVG